MAETERKRARLEPVNVPPPPPPEQPPMMVLRAPLGSRLTVVCLNDRLHGAMTHWLDGREVPCGSMFNEPCSLCLHKGPAPRWAGWFGAIVLNQKGIRLGCVTAGAYNACKTLQVEQGSMRGLVLSLGRTKLTPQAPVTVRILDRYQEELPPAPDVGAALLRLWGVRAQQGPNGEVL